MIRANWVIFNRSNLQIFSDNQKMTLIKKKVRRISQNFLTTTSKYRL